MRYHLFLVVILSLVFPVVCQGDDSLRTPDKKMSLFVGATDGAAPAVTQVTEDSIKAAGESVRPNKF